MKNWNRIIAFVIAFVLCALSVPLSSDAKAEYVEGEALVVLRNATGYKLTKSALSTGVGASYVQSAASAAGAKPAATYHSLSESANEIFVHMKSDTKTTAELLAELEKNPDVISAAPNYLKRVALTPNDPAYNGRFIGHTLENPTLEDLWGLKKIGADSAWNSTTGSRGISVAVIDTGVDLTHPDFFEYDSKGDRVATNLDIARKYNSIDKNNDVTDDEGHGTHVTGTIGAVGNNGIGVTGVNWKVNVIPIRAANEDGFPDSAIIGAIDYVVALQVSGNLRIYAVNMSYGGYSEVDPETAKTTANYKAYKILNDMNKTLMIVAAGNDGIEVGVPYPNAEDGKNYYVYPASYIDLDNMIVVGAVAENGERGYEIRDGKKEYFSNFSTKYVHLAAPGVGITSTVPVTVGSVVSRDPVLGNVLVSADVYYDSWPGTSMAAPHVTGAVALLAARNKDLTTTQLKELLFNNATQPTNTTAFTKYGFMNLGSAMYNVDRMPTITLQSVSLTPKSVTLNVYGTSNLNLTITPADATGVDVFWDTSNRDVARVENGKVTGMSLGTATITATVIQGARILNAKTDVSVVSRVPDPDPYPDGRPKSSGGGGCEVGVGFAALALSAMAFYKKRGK
ncbi:hypothetical protein AGMMS50276_26560 [Synergistales bacterium]|nr:hypothetical protein AGMMS50276_26560 [Synergistales bacterium]